MDWLNVSFLKLSFSSVQHCVHDKLFFEHAFKLSESVPSFVKLVGECVWHYLHRLVRVWWMSVFNALGIYLAI